MRQLQRRCGEKEDDPRSSKDTGKRKAEPLVPSSTTRGDSERGYANGGVARLPEKHEHV